MQELTKEEETRRCQDTVTRLILASRGDLTLLLEDLGDDGDASAEEGQGDDHGPRAVGLVRQTPVGHDRVLPPGDARREAEHH